MLYHPDFKHKILALRGEAYKEFEEMKPFEAQSALGHVARRWNNLTEELKREDPYSLQNYYATLKRTLWYLQLGRTKMNNCLPLLFQPPILYGQYWISTDMSIYLMKQQKNLDGTGLRIIKGFIGALLQEAQDKLKSLITGFRRMEGMQHLHLLEDQ